MTPYKIWNDWEDKEDLIFIPKGKYLSYLFRLAYNFHFFFVLLPKLSDMYANPSIFLSSLTMKLLMFKVKFDK